MVEGFRAPVLTDHLAHPGYRFALRFMGGAKKALCHLRLPAFFSGAVDARGFDDLRYARKWADLGIHRHDGDVPDLISAMPALQLAHQIHGAVFEQLLRVFPAVPLVVLDGGEVFPAQLKDYTIRFFWVCSASEVTVAFSKKAALCLRSSCAKGSSGSSFAPLQLAMATGLPFSWRHKKWSGATWTGANATCSEGVRPGGASTDGSQGETFGQLVLVDREPLVEGGGKGLRVDAVDEIVDGAVAGHDEAPVLIAHVQAYGFALSLA
jgi:hypothetical protein